MNNLDDHAVQDERYQHAAIGHTNAARAVYRHLRDENVPRNDSTWVALHNIIGFSLEVALKAYLASHGIQQKELRRCSHNLIALYEMSVKAGLNDEQLRVGEDELSLVLEKVAKILDPDHGLYRYRYLGGDELNYLEEGLSTEVTIKAIFKLTDLVALRTTDLK